MTEFTVDARSITSKGDGKVRAFVTSPSGVRTEALVNNQSNGQYRLGVISLLKDYTETLFSDVFTLLVNEDHTKLM